MTHGVLLLHTNAPIHTSQVAMTAATEWGFEFLPHPLYSADMVPSDSNLFSKSEYLGDPGEDLLF